MDNRDEIIRTQMDVIGTLINNNMRRMADDLWGTSNTPAKPNNPSSKKLCQDEDKKQPVREKEAKQPSTEEATENTPPEKIEDLKAELNELIGLEGVKKRSTI